MVERMKEEKKSFEINNIKVNASKADQTKSK